jgi:Peptidase C39 family
MAKNLIFLLVLMWTAATVSALQETDTSLSFENTESKTTSINEQPFNWAPSWRTSDSDCGQVAAYFIARLHNKDLTIAEVKNDLPIAHEEGTSCAEIVSYLKTKGISYETVWIAPDRFAELPMPAIVHIKNKIVKSGHFWVVLDYDSEKDEFAVLDTVYGGISVVEGKRIRLPASGFAIVPNLMNRKLRTVLLLGGILCTGVGAGFTFHRVRNLLVGRVNSIGKGPHVSLAESRGTPS